MILWDEELLCSGGSHLKGYVGICIGTLPPIMENQVEKKMEKCEAPGSLKGVYRDM